MMKQKIGVLLINLGTPSSFQPKDVYRYLIEFLTDPRVIDTPWLMRQLLVRGVIVPKRYKNSAKCYEQIWTAEGSPLMVYGNRVKGLLQQVLGEKYSVELAMRYQQPSIENALSCLLKSNIEELLIFPLFPQYASATTGSILQKVMEYLRLQYYIPKTKWINHFASHPAYLDALFAVAKRYSLDRYDYVLFSYHGLPQRHIQKNGCYLSDCYATTQALVDKFKIPKDKFCVVFQSRLGKEPWLEPYTNEKIVALAKQNHKRVLVFCPSFVCDCLETLYEIGIEYAAEFNHVGGEQLDLVQSLNDHPQWINALKNMVLEYTEP